jgi:hypothetical protein
MTKSPRAMLDSIPPLPLYTLTRAGVNFCNAYMQLAPSNREKVDGLLLGHAFIPIGTSPYLWYAHQGTQYELMVSYKQFLYISEEIAEAWYSWAYEISEMRPSRLQCRDAILGLLSRLVYSKFAEQMDSLAAEYCTKKRKLSKNRTRKNDR